MIASCGHRVKSYRAKQCKWCKRWFCRPCYSEHISSPKVHCTYFKSKKKEKEKEKEK